MTHLEQQDKRIEALEENVEYHFSLVAKISKGEGEPIELEATQNPKGEGELIKLKAAQDPGGEGVPIELEATQNPMHKRNTRLGNFERKMLNLEVLKTIIVSHNFLIGTMDDIKDDVKETVNIIQGKLHELKRKINLLVRVANNLIMGSYKVGKTKTPEPKAFGGARATKEEDSFLFYMELYFNGTKNNYDESRLKIVLMYLANDAKLWWRIKVEETISGQCSIVSWDNFKKELKAYLIWEYVRDFSTLMLDIKDMTGTYRLFNLLKGLKPWVRNELMRQNVKELNPALATAESLDDYSNDASKRKFGCPPSLDNCSTKKEGLEL
ncbi:hypothetical protein P3X46_004614 [Hevea brasiliensis]|uniref:Retrotransposon gag domain-containing protein n=1 Tax=Hevea brasiliensis TaxID=3981 RepID=A0ABQ9N262_HEVBR|nr:hypothetical protein P3X46_004614 [Hevea brasiliensis]